jgi:hypothetical protein
MTKKSSTVTQAFDALSAQHAAGKPEPKAHPQFLRPREIKLWPEVFQHRRPAEHVSAQHVRELQRTLANQDLEPVLVWWDGKKWACIDGHHRLRAYVESSRADHSVPVTVFSGSPQAAMEAAASRNTKDKLAMTRSEKVGTAWRLLLTTDLSKAATVRASGASDGIVGHMRRVKAQLSAKGRDLGSLSWEQARQLAAGESSEEDVDWEDRTRQEAEEMANAITKALGKRPGQRIEAFAMALEMIDARLPGMLAEFWSTSDEDDADE